MKFRNPKALFGFVVGWILFSAGGFACTDIIVGKKASTDGSVITSHTGACDNCRVHVVPARTFEKGTMAPVYYGILDPSVTSS